MDIDEIQRRKIQLEARIAEAVTHEIARFRRDTGYSPSSVDIDMIDTKGLGESKHHYVVVDCRTTITL